MNDSKQFFSFAQPQSFKVIANHGEKAFYGLILIGILYTFQDFKGQFLIDVVLLASALFTILIIVAKFLSKVAWRFDVDFNTKNIAFYLCRTTSPVHVSFSDIDQIKVSGVIIFFIKHNKIFYSTKQFIEILVILKKIKRITWGKMCDILGPNISIRETIEKG